MMHLTVDLTVGKKIQFLGHYAPLDDMVINLFLLCCLIQLRAELFGNQKFGGPLTATAPITLTRPKNIFTYSILACLPSPYVLLFANDSKRLNIQIHYSGGPHVVSCEQCMLSSCLTPQYNVCSFVVLQRPPYLMVPETVTTH